MNPILLLESELKPIPDYARVSKFRLGMTGDEAKHPNEAMHREKYERIVKLQGVLKDIRTLDFIDAKNTSANANKIKDIFNALTHDMHTHIRAYLGLTDDLAAKEAQIKEDVNFWNLLERIYFIKTYIYPRHDKEKPEQECAAVDQAYKKLISHEEKLAHQPNKSAFSFLWSTPQEKLQKILSELDTSFQPSGSQTIQLGTINELIDTCFSAIGTDANIDNAITLLQSKIAAYNQTKPQPKLEAKQVPTPKTEPAEIKQVAAPKPGYAIKITPMNSPRSLRCDRLKAELKYYQTDIIDALRIELAQQNAKTKKTIQIPKKIEDNLTALHVALGACIQKLDSANTPEQEIAEVKSMPKFVLLRQQNNLITLHDLEQIHAHLEELFDWITTVDLVNKIEALATTQSRDDRSQQHPARPESPAPQTADGNDEWADQKNPPAPVPTARQSVARAASSTNPKSLPSLDEIYPHSQRVLPSFDELKTSLHTRSDSKASVGAQSPYSLSPASSFCSELNDRNPMLTPPRSATPIPQALPAQAQPITRRKSFMEHMSDAGKALVSALTFLKQKLVNAFLCLFCCGASALQKEDENDDKIALLTPVVDDKTITPSIDKPGSSTYTGPLLEMNKRRKPIAITVQTQDIVLQQATGSERKASEVHAELTIESPTSSSSDSTPTAGSFSRSSRRSSGGI